MFYPTTPFIKYPNVESQLLKRNAAKTQLLVEWLCKTPETTTYRVNLLRTTLEKIKTQISKAFEEKYGEAPKMYTLEGLPEVLCIESMIKCEYTGDLTSCKEIVVDAKCGAALLRGAHIYAPGVLGMQSGIKLGEKVCVFADLSGGCKRGTNVVYENVHKTFIGVGVVRMQRYQLFGENLSPRGLAIEMLQTVSGVPSLPEKCLSAGDVLLQNFPSIVCCRVLDPQSTDIVLDMCAAPGNKTTHLVELMGKTGSLVALDKTETKINILKQTLNDFSIDNVQCYAFDSTKALSSDTVQSMGEKGPPFPPEYFDKILLDAPCSALGNRPLLSDQLHENMLKSFPILQKKLLKNAFGLLKPGGTLVYSTCTVTEDENELMVKWFLDNFSEIKLVEAVPVYGAPGHSNTGLTEEQRNFVQRFSYEGNRRHVDSVAFFIAKFLKIGDTNE